MLQDLIEISRISVKTEKLSKVVLFRVKYITLGLLQQQHLRDIFEYLVICSQQKSHQTIACLSQFDF